MNCGACWLYSCLYSDYEKYSSDFESVYIRLSSILSSASGRSEFQLHSKLHQFSFFSPDDKEY